MVSLFLIMLGWWDNGVPLPLCQFPSLCTFSEHLSYNPFPLPRDDELHHSDGIVHLYLALLVAFAIVPQTAVPKSPE